MSDRQRFRVELVDAEHLTPEQQPVADRISGTRGRLPGPFTALLQVPELADRVQSLGAYLRYEGILDRDIAEWAILVVAKHWDSAYVWDAHAPIAQRHGVSDEALQVLAGGDAEISQRLRVVRAFAHELASSGRVPDEAFDEARTLLGTEGVIELSVVVGYYSLISLTLNALGWD